MMRSVISGLLLMSPRIQKRVHESQLSKRYLSQMNRKMSHRRAGLFKCVSLYINMIYCIKSKKE